MVLRKSDRIGTCGETRSSGLWGTGRGGRGSDGRNATVKRGLLALLVFALAAPLAASAGSGYRADRADSYLAPSLRAAASSTPNAEVPVIVQSDRGAGKAQDALEEINDAVDSTRLQIVDAAAAELRAGDLPELAKSSGLVIVPDTPVVLDGLNDVKEWNDKKVKRKSRSPQSPQDFSSKELWTSAVGLDRLWPTLPSFGRSGTRAPSIAFVDSGIEATRSDFAGRIRAEVNLTSLPGNSAGDGRGHGTFVAGLAAGNALGRSGAAPSAGIVSIDVMDDQGMARTSDVIAAAQWILRNKQQYDIRVANFSLHSATASSFRWDPLDKALEKLWFGGVVVVASSGNDGKDGAQGHVTNAPANDPFVITVGALDLHNSASPERATLAPWSTWGYTYDGFAKPEISAPGRKLTGPIPAGSTLAKQRPAQVVHTPEGAYMELSGTSLAAPIVAGIAADLLMLHPTFTPDQVKGALMVAARPVPRATAHSAGVGEVFAPQAAAMGAPPNPNLALNRFVVADPNDGGTPTFDDAAWLAAAKSATAWDAVSWLDGWDDAAWSLVSWSDVSWSDVSWSDVSWTDVSWSDVSWTDVSWNDVSWADSVYGDVG
jgi:serine protease AprX